jgi:cytochrome P450
MGFIATQTTSSISTFLLCMVLFPDVQKRIQAELDTVVGRKRLPTFEDRASLPYLDATIKESLRFHPPTPLGIAHRLVEDDVVQGEDPRPFFFLFLGSPRLRSMHHKK